MFRRQTSRKRFGCKAILALAIAMVVGFTNNTHASGLLIADGGFGGVLEIQSHDVNVTINNGIAVTEVEQVFLNTENRIVEALYTFPVPRGASVSNFSMWINGKEMIGEVVEKQRAREIYESYKQTRRDPGLLEQVDYKTFEMRIFPIPAGAEQRVKVTYYQELDFDHSDAVYVYPLATVTRTDIDQRVRGRFSLQLRAKSEIPIGIMSSPSHGEDFVIASHNENFFEASLEASGSDLDRDLVIRYENTRPKTGFDVIASREGRGDGFFMLTLTTGEELEKLDVGMDYIFVLDVSGSMANDGKLHLSGESIGAFISALGENDRFDVMAFNVRPETLFQQLADASDDAKQQALEFLASQKARGGTNLRPALENAYRYDDPDRVLNVVILSDGMTETDEQRALVESIAQRPAGARVFCIGVGNEVNRPLLSQLAEKAGGLAAFISHGDDFEAQARVFRRKLTRAAAENVRIRFEGGGIYDVTPAEASNLYFGAPLRLYGRYKDAGKVKVTVEADVQGRALKQTHNIELPRQEDDNPEIERMWAYERVQELLEDARRTGSRDSVINEIVELCEGFSIVSEYASMIVLENDAEYRRWKIEQKNATRVARDRSAQSRLRELLNQMRDEAMAQLGPVENVSVEKKPVSNSPQVNRSQPNAPIAQPDSPRNRNLDFGTPRNNGGGGGGRGGGGAIDPITGAIALGIAGMFGAAGMHRKRRKSNGGNVSTDES